MNSFKPAEPTKFVPWMTYLGLPLLLVLLLTLAVLSPVPVVRWVFLGILVLDLGVYYGCWAYAPAAYEVDDRGITIHRKKVHPVHLPWSDLADVREVNLQGTRTMRVAGVGGLYYFGGLFSNSKLGRFYTSVTDFKHAVFLEGRGVRSWMISPADPAGFVAAVREKLTPPAG